MINKTALLTISSLVLMGCTSVYSGNAEFTHSGRKISFKYAIINDGASSRVKIISGNGYSYEFYRGKIIDNSDVSFVGGSGGVEMLIGATCVLIIPYQSLPNK